jgi:predicted esterase
MTSTVIIDGEEVQISNGDRENARAWFMYSEEDYSDASMALKEVPMIYHGLDASIEHLRKFLETEVDDECVIFGFSQGATFCHVLSVLAHHAKQRDNTDPVIAPFAKIQKTILVSGFAHMHQNPLAESLEDTTNNIIQVQSLHVYGEGDTSVPRHFSEDLVKCFVGAEVYVHEKGHFIPHNKALIDTILCFLDC